MAPGKVKWDTKEMPVRHSEYVDVVHARFLALLDGLEQMRVLGLPASVRTLLVRGAVLHVMEQLVEAYSRIQGWRPKRLLQTKRYPAP